MGLTLLAACTTLRQRYPGPDVLFVATPEAVSLEMLRVAAVTADDVVFDLGSGDGRVVISAARDFGARGVGVEIDPSLVRISREAALGAGVADRATFLWQDLFATDLTAATVVTLYLRDDVNLKLRPKLLRELAPGTRVVSHDFDMGDWRPDHVEHVRGPSREHSLYLWLIPADAAGVWQARLGQREGVLTLTQRYQALSGTLAADGSTRAIGAGRIVGDGIEFSVDGMTFSGRVHGDAIDGATWSARRSR
jgi:SAM-dependent methyltransferase